MSPEATKVLMVVFPALTLLITAFMPAALQVSFFVSGMLSLIQSTLFRMPAFRTYFNMYPLPTPAPATSPTPYPGTMNVRAPLSQAELSATYQATRTPASGASELKAGQEALQSVNPSQQGMVRKFMSGAVGGAVKDIKTTVQGATTSARELLGRGQKDLEQKQAKTERATARVYEEKRQREIAQQQYERRGERKAQRAAKMSTRSR
jgi:YidC/Oxa1 family membrane protein insertase